MSRPKLNVVFVASGLLHVWLLSSAMAQVAVPGAAKSSRELPRTANQVYSTYPLERYVSHLKTVDHPERAIVDWVLRETGTELWFNEPFGFFNANAVELAVYHTPETQDVVKKLVDRFTLGPTDPQVVKLRLLTVSSPNWRSRALPLIQDVSVQSPGVQAWLLTKENTAILTSMLKARTDTRVIRDADFEIHNGQLQRFSKVKGRNFVRTIRQSTTVWPPYEPEMGQIKEGYELEISPLLELDGKTLDCVVRANIDQVDRLVPVDLELPLPNGQTHRARIEVPQVVSWRLHERFRWDHEMVLLLSCGVVASPDRAESLIPMLDVSRLIGNTPGRADALLFIEFGGRASEGLRTVPKMATRPDSVSRGRY